MKACLLLLVALVAGKRVLTETASIQAPEQSDPTDPGVSQAPLTTDDGEAQEKPVEPNQPKVDPAFECDVWLVKPYGIQGIPRPNSLPTKSCPGSKQTCCSQEDDLAFQETWSKQRVKIESHYNAYLAFLRYTLGLAEELRLVAKENLDSQNADCKVGSQDLIALGLTRSHATEIYKSAVEKVQKLAELRSGFFCSMCDASVQRELREYWKIHEMDVEKSLFLTQQNCQNLVSIGIESAFYHVTYLKRFLEDAVMVMNCKSGASLRPQLQADLLTKQRVKNCFFFRKTHFFYYCQSFCNELRIGQKSPLIDGDLDAFRPFFEAISAARKTAIPSPENNFLSHGSHDEDLLKEFYAASTHTNSFFESTDTKGVDLAEKDSVFVRLEGADIWSPAKGNLFPIDIKRADIAAAALAALLGVFVWR